MKDIAKISTVIFCIDDDPQMRSLIAALLESSKNLIVHQFPGAREALGYAGTLKPDIILFDVMMPDMDGMSAYKKLRSDKAFDRVKVAFITARKRMAHLEQYTSLGVPVLAKPFTLQEFQEFMESLL